MKYHVIARGTFDNYYLLDNGNWAIGASISMGYYKAAIFDAKQVSKIVLEKGQKTKLPIDIIPAK